MKPDTDVALGGRYRLASRIAVGGMGEVWVAHDMALARDVAVKVLREEFAGDAGFLERFRTEARNSAQLSHPNIAQLYDYGEQEGSGFLVMELVLGEPMSDLLDRQPVLPTRRLLPILAQTARALHAAHVAGVVHRDVKPGNILLARSGRVKITDFGISMASNQIPMTASGMVMGTAQYLSPEQAIGRAATPASDIYSLGIVAYEGLVGNRPFTGPTAVDIAVAHVNTPVPPLPSDIEPHLAALVMRMLAKEPEERPRSAASLARTLDGMLDRTPPGGLPMPYGRHARTADIIDAAEMSDREAEQARRPATQGLPTTGVAPAVVPPAEPPAWPVPLPPGEAPAGGPGPGSGPVAAAGTTSTGSPGSGREAGGDAAERRGPEEPDGASPSSADAGAGARGALAAPVATVVPGRALQDATAVTPPEPPPTYVPRPEPYAAGAAGQAAPPTLQPSAGAGRPGSGTDGGAARSIGRRRARETEVRRTSTTTGLRWGTVSRPLVVLVLMVLFALLGAAFADKVWGSARAIGAPDEHGSVRAVVASPGDGPARGRIGASVDGAGPGPTVGGPVAMTAAAAGHVAASGTPAGQGTTAQGMRVQATGLDMTTARDQ